LRPAQRVDAHHIPAREVAQAQLEEAARLVQCVLRPERLFQIRLDVRRVQVEHVHERALQRLEACLHLALDPGAVQARHVRANFGVHAHERCLVGT
jgi:hypothetical protein